MVKKKYISANELLINSFILAKSVYYSGYIPDFILMISRGGFPISIAVHEYFRFKGIEIDHSSVRAISYKQIGKREENTQLFGIDNIQIKNKKNVLIIDDVLDTGKTLRKITDALPKNINKKIAVIYFKPEYNEANIKPDFYVEKTDQWLVFPHEISGLTKEEILKKDKRLFRILF